MISDIKQLFMYVLIWISSLEKCSFSSSVLFVDCSFGGENLLFLCIDFSCILSVSSNSGAYNYRSKYSWFGNIFSHCIGCPLILLVVNFLVQTFLVQSSHLFMLSFVAFLWCQIMKYHCQDPYQEAYTVFFCRSFMDSEVAFKPLNHFHLIFVFEVRWKSSFILLNVMSSFPNIPYLRVYVSPLYILDSIVVN